MPFNLEHWGIYFCFLGEFRLKYCHLNLKVILNGYFAPKTLEPQFYRYRSLPLILLLLVWSTTTMVVIIIIIFIIIIDDEITSFTVVCSNSYLEYSSFGGFCPSVKPDSHHQCRSGADMHFQQCQAIRLVQKMMSFWPNSENQNPLIILSVAPSDIGYYFCRGSGRNRETLDTMPASVYVKGKNFA